MTRKIVLSTFALLLALVLSGILAHATDNFFVGKTVRIMVGFSPGGGFDAYSRLLARHLPQHIPGNPTVVVQNRPGASGLITANVMYKKAKPDGLTIGQWPGSWILARYMGRYSIVRKEYVRDRRARFDFGKIGWIGAPVRFTYVCMTNRASGVIDLATWRAGKQPVKFGVARVGDNLAYNHAPRILIAHTDLPIVLVENFNLYYALLSYRDGVVGGVCGSWEEFKNRWTARLASGDMRVLAQFVDKPHPELAGVPVTNDVIRSYVGRLVMNILMRDTHGALNRPYSVPPGTPRDRLMVLRRAFDAAMKDPELLAEAKKRGLPITPVSGEDVDKIVAGVAGLQPELWTAIKTTIVPKK